MSVPTSAAPRPPPAPARARIAAISRDGSRSAEFVLSMDETRVGRTVPEGEVRLDDPFVSGVHAVFRFDGPQLVLVDLGSQNGVYLMVRERRLEPGDELRIGRQRLRIDRMPEEPVSLAEQPLWGSPDPGYTARVVQLLEGGVEGDEFPLAPGDNTIGRAAGDVTFPSDGYVSGRHASVNVGADGLSVKDLGSANGTFVRIQGAARLHPGDLLLIGEQLLRVGPA